MIILIFADDNLKRINVQVLVAPAEQALRVISQTNWFNVPIMFILSTSNAPH